VSRKASVPWASALSGVLFVACGTQPGTERVFDGRTISGPYIEPSAYAAYADGAYLEARGEWKAAEDAYRRALEQDPDSPSIWTRIGAIQCRTDLARALEAFRAATEHSSHGPAWAARARCLHDHGRSAEALAAAKAAIGFDPPNAEANLLIADIYREQARPASSRAWLFAWLLLDPSAVSHWKALEERAKVLGDPALSLLIRAALEHGAQQGSELSAAALSALQPLRPGPGLHPDLEAAITRGDLPSARAAAQEVGLSALELALFALHLGKPGLAASQAELVLDANPESADAWIVALSAAAVSSDQENFTRLLAHAGTAQLPTTELAQRIADLLRWWVNDAAAAEWTEAYRAQTRGER
jgi:hypothetical protein